MSISRKLGAGLAVAALVITSVVAMSASASAVGPTDDNFANATVIGDTLTLNLNNTDATTQSGENTTLTEVAAKHILSTVWAKWTAPATGSLEADTDGSSGSIDTSLAIFTSTSGTSVSKAKRLAWDEHAQTSDPTAIENWSRINGVGVKKGTTYYFQIGSLSLSSTVSTGDLELTLDPTYTAPANDNVGNAITETGSSFSISQGTYGSTMQNFEDFPAEGSVWYKWKPASIGDLTVDMVLSFPDSYAALWEQDNSGSTPTGELKGIDSTGGGDSMVDQLDPDSTYYISVGSSSGVDGTAKVKVTETVTGPLITKISPSSGKIAGGTKVTITGKRLTDVNEIDLGATSTNGLNLHIVSSTKLTFVAPAVLNPGKVWVRLDTAGLESVINTASHFTYK